jgi:quercetin dioxygenase-like cupin family protein
MRWTVLTVLLSAGLLAGAVTGIALATAAFGVTSTPVAQGTLDPITIKTKIGDWESEMETKGQSSLVVVENKVAPGGHFGWHSHPGPSLVIVKSGTSTFYRGDDPTCTGQVHPAGSAYVDPGGIVHTARNEGNVELVLIVIRLLPQPLPPGVTARIDASDPGNCDF